MTRNRYLLIIGLIVLLGMQAVSADIPHLFTQTTARNPLTRATSVSFGTTYAGTITQMGQYDPYTFYAVANDKVFIRLSCEWGYYPRIKVKNPDGSLLQETTSYGAYSTELHVVCSVGGTYTIEIGDWEGDSFGQYGVYIQRTNNPGNLVSLSPGQTLENTINSRGQFCTYSITPATNTDIFLRLTSDWGYYPRIKVFNPDGTLLQQSTSFGAYTSELSATCSQVGAYTVLVGDWEGDSTGRIGVTAQYRAGPGTPTVYSTPVEYGRTSTGSISKLGQFAPYTFDTAGQDRVFIRLCTNWGYYPRIKVFKPDGSLLEQTTNYGAYSTELLVFCIAPGTYTVLVGDWEGDSTGEFGVFFQRTNNPVHAVFLDSGQTIENSVDTRGQFLTYTITPDSNTDIFLRLTSDWGYYPRIKVFNPDGSLLQQTTSYGAYSTELRPTVIMTGLYTVLAGDWEGDSTGRTGITAQYVPSPVAASFVYTAPCQFTDTSTGNPTWWSWSFGDGTTSTQQSPSHCYASPGTYTVTLTVGKTGAAPSSTSQTIVFATTLTASFNSIKVPSTTTPRLYFFQDTSTGDPASWSWNFGDGSTSSLRFPMHQYPGPGTYSVTLTVSKGQATSTISQSLVVLDPAPTEATTTPTTVTTTATITTTTTLTTTQTPAGGLEFGKTYSGTISQPNERDSYTVNLQANDRFFVRMNSVWSAHPQIIILNPDNSQLDESWSGWSRNELTVLAPTTGTYTVLLGDWDGDNTGAYTFFVQRLNNPGLFTSILPGGEIRSSIVEKSEYDTYTFLATSGDRFLLRMNSSWSAHPQIRVFKPDGTPIGDAWSGWSRNEVSVLASTTGTYTVLVGDWDGDDFGDYHLYIQRLNNPGGSQFLQSGQTISGSIQGGSGYDTYSITPRGATDMLLRMTSSWSAHPQIRVFNPDGTPLGDAWSGWSLNELSVRASTTGTYTVLAGDWDCDDSGTYTLYAFYQSSTAPIVAGFSATPTYGPAPLQVQFTSTSTGPFIDLLWAIYRGQTPIATMAGVTPTYTFPSPGTYTVTLTARNEQTGASDTESKEIIVSTPSSQQPYPSPHTLPGRIEAEDYDTGGQGVAYSDTTAVNEGRAYRNDGVDIEIGGSNYNVAYIRAGEYLDYSVDTTVNTAGVYHINARYTNPSGTKAVTIRVDGAPTATLSLPGTGSWSTWRTSTSSVFTLPTGRHVVTIEMGTSASFNLDYYDFQRVDGPITTTMAPTTSVTTESTKTVTTTMSYAGSASFIAVPTTVKRGAAVKFTVTPTAGKFIRSVWWSFDSSAHMNTWNSKVTNPTFYYPATGTFSPLAKITYTDNSVETVRRDGYVRVT